MTRRFVSSVAILVVLVLTPWLCNAAAPDIDPALLGGMKWRQIGPFRGGRVVAVTGVPGDPEHLVFRRSRRRRVEKHRCRRFVEAHVRRPEDRVDRRDRGRRLGPQRHLCRFGGSLSARQYHLRRRRLQISGRGPHLEEHGAARHAADRRRDRASQQPGHRARRRSRTCLRSERGTGRVPQRGRRADLEQGLVQGPGHRCDRRGIRSWQSQRRLCFPVADAPPALEPFERRPGLRPVQIDGCRTHVEASRGTWTAFGDSRAHRRVGGGRGIRARVRHDRSGRRRPVPLG